MKMRVNKELKLHFVNVNHGDCTIIEFPDHGNPPAHFAVVDFGAKKGVDRGLARDYLKALVEVRRDNDPDFDYRIDFACVTHPHDDHYGGLTRFLDEFVDKVSAFWDCGFRTTSVQYNRELERISEKKNLTFVRVGSGTELEFGGTRVTILAPSVDLRNRFDTLGVGKNDSCVVLKIKHKNSYAILAADAEYASWGKITEEFPRTRSINFFNDALGLSERDETADQLRCDLLRISHHGSKHGSSLEYLERLRPHRVVIAAGSESWYKTQVSNWANKFPHPLVKLTLKVLDDTIDTRVTGEEGNLIFKYSGHWSPREIVSFKTRADEHGFTDDLCTVWVT